MLQLSYNYAYVVWKDSNSIPAISRLAQVAPGMLRWSKLQGDCFVVAVA
jgi:hypothetical protein